MTDRKDIDNVSGTATTGHEWDGIKELNTPLPRWWVSVRSRPALELREPGRPARSLEERHPAGRQEPALMESLVRMPRPVPRHLQRKQ